VLGNVKRFWPDCPVMVNSQSAPRFPRPVRPLSPPVCSFQATGHHPAVKSKSDVNVTKVSPEHTK